MRLTPKSPILLSLSLGDMSEAWETEMQCLLSEPRVGNPVTPGYQVAYTHSSLVFYPMLSEDLVKLHFPKVTVPRTRGTLGTQGRY